MAISPVAFVDFQETHGTELWFQKFREALQAASWCGGFLSLVIDGLDELGVPPIQENLHHDGISI
jgi:hypothetical protein